MSEPTKPEIVREEPRTHTFRVMAAGRDFVDRLVDFMECGGCGLLLSDIQLETGSWYPKTCNDMLQLD
jgi:hypothetical protein